uniref:Uncharacterized protein n=1 Tax=Cacopsylla melanoneura TaxID=428564 RepID=A0A8D8TFP1_9HEMI
MYFLYCFYFLYEIGILKLIKNKDMQAYKEKGVFGGVFFCLIFIFSILKSVKNDVGPFSKKLQALQYQLVELTDFYFLFYFPYIKLFTSPVYVMFGRSVEISHWNFLLI